MRKQMVKKLYTLYTVEGELEAIRNDPNHIFSSYSGGKAECIQYHNTVSEWLEEIMYILSCDYKHGFGIKVYDENGERGIDISRYDLQCYTCECNKKSQDEIIKVMAKILTYYFDDNSYYYEMEDDHIYCSIEHTGHQYYNSPYESYDNCGTCDGARCDYCKTKYVVKDLHSDKVYYEGYDKEKAECIYREYEKDYTNIINDILYNYDINEEWFEKEIGTNTNIKALYKVLREYKIPYISIK